MKALSREEPPALLIPRALSAHGAGRQTTADHAVADGLVASHHYLCRRGARKFWRAGLERNDLEQVAALGLIKASRRFDPATRTPFEAYAWLIIVGELMHYVRDHERTVRVPRRLQGLERRFRSAHDTLRGRFGREPSDAELANELGVLSTTVAELRQTHDAALPLPLEEAEGRAARDPAALALEDRVLVDRAFSELAPQERRVIVGVYMLGLTQMELGRRLGLSAKRVSRMHQAALSRMQRVWASGT